MKTKSHLFRWPLALVSLALLATTALLVAGKSPARYTAHEWGTFTSIQGGDGGLLEWAPLETSRLPQFVYDWKNPGLKRQPRNQFIWGKGAMYTLQRMETPVIYFYSDAEQTVDVSVEFPKGLITEWYPQAVQIGPSSMPTPPAIAKLDEYAHKAGAKPSFTFASLLGICGIKESRARWANVRLLPNKPQPELAALLPVDKLGTHYLAARDTDANLLRISSLEVTNPAPEHEKFIFYRGVGSFKTPLQVTTGPDNTLILHNTGKEQLSHLFVLSMNEGLGGFIYVPKLEAGAQRSVSISAGEQTIPATKVAIDLGRKMAKALTSEGLFEREATAMVNTWKDSWFSEQGLRVLYVLPRAWTDETLPLTLDPVPRQLVRVMVGRAEVISPAVEQSLAQHLVKAKQGDAQAQERVVAEFRKLGRFGEAALRLATREAANEVKQNGWNLLQAAATKPNPAGKPL